MGVDYGPYIRPHFVYAEVKRQLHRRLVDAGNGAVRAHHYDILPAQGALVYAAGGYPHIAVGVLYGEVAARGGGHAVAVNALHDHHELVGGVHYVKHHGFHFLFTILPPARPKFNPQKALAARRFG